MASYQCRSVVFGRAFAVTVLGAFGTRPAAALLVAPKVRLSCAPGFAPVPAMALADLTPDEADYTGYAAGGVAPTFSATVNLTPNILGQVANCLYICTATSAAVRVTATGWWMDDGANVVCAERFAQALTFSFVTPGDFLDLQVAAPSMMLQAAA